MTTTGESSADIERDAESERAGLVNTLDQLRENLRPANVVDEVMAGAKISLADISDRIWHTARSHPLPSVFIGLGAAMIMGVGQKMRAQPSLPDHEWSDTSRFADAGNTRASSRRIPSPASASVKTRLSNQLDLVGASATRAASKIADSASDLGREARRTASQYASSAREGLSSVSGESAMNQVSRSRDQVANSISKLLDEQPLVLAALGIAVGAAIGAAIPSSDTEGQWMGEASGSVKQAARDLARDQFDQLKQTAGHTLEEVKRSAAEHGLSTDNLTDLVQDVGTKVQSGAYQAGSKVADAAPIRG